MNIVRLGHPVLRQVAVQIDPEQLKEEAFQEQIDLMVETMRLNNGVGLAAPQVDWPVRMFCYEVRENPRYPGRESVGLQILINPEVKPVGEELELDWEGCLSIPEMRGVVPRFASVEVSALDRAGAELKYTAEAFEARIIQHELDHLNGIVFLERMTDLKTLTHLEEFEQFWV